MNAGASISLVASMLVVLATNDRGEDSKPSLEHWSLGDGGAEGRKEV